jgi:hypothetical protein
MLAARQHLILTVIAAIGALLVVIDLIMVKSNQTLNTEIAQRTQFLQQSVQLESLQQQMIKALAELAVKNNDAQIRELLNSQGITFSQNATSSNK